MKKRRFALAMAFVLALALTGCSANRENNSDPVAPSNDVSESHNGGQNSANMGDAAGNSPGISDSAGGNDAMQGGGAGGTNDVDNDGLPEGGDSQSRSRSNSGGNVMDDIGDAAGDLARGAGNAVRDAGDAIGNAANDVGRAMR